MKFNQRVVIPVACGPLWDFLMEIPKVARLLPGVESVTKIDETSYQGALRVKVGPISLNLQGKIFVEKRDWETRTASLRVEANDRHAAGGVKGRTNMELREIGPAETELAVETEVNVLGKIGEFGQPVIRKKADTMLKAFVENIKKQLVAES